MAYKIGNLKNPTLFWSNEIGWVDQYEADVFSRDQQTYLNLPIEGHWVPLWSIDLAQFSRFIAECEACGVFTDKEKMQEVADSMDLEFHQVFSIINRAQNCWDEEKEKV